MVKQNWPTTEGLKHPLSELIPKAVIFYTVLTRLTRRGVLQRRLPFRIKNMDGRSLWRGRKWKSVIRMGEADAAPPKIRLLSEFGH